MKTKAIVIAFHKYTNFGDKFYEVIFDYMLGWLKKYQDEYDRVYFVDSNWGIMPSKDRMFQKATVISVNPHLRYYDAYKEVLSQIKEDLVLFLDNDFIIYKPRVIFEAFEWLKKYDVVSIYDTCGTYKTNKLNGKNKFCPYFFATRKETLMKFRDCEWGPNLPEHETFGKLTEEMLYVGVRPKEIEEDKSNFLFGEELGNRRSKNLGYYHIRAGSTVPYLLSHRERGDKQYTDYLKNQPRSEYLRHFCWYQIMGGNVTPMLEDLKIGVGEWDEYVKNFRIFHGLCCPSGGELWCEYHKEYTAYCKNDGRRLLK
mgnify:CR=1 FL=1